MKETGLRWKARLGRLMIPFFPRTVFGPYPVDTAASLPAGRSEVKATGCFLKLKQLEPTIEIGKGVQKFTNAIANIIPLAQGRLMIYIHHTAQHKLGKTESDWGIFLDRSTVRTVEPGKVYGWQDRWAVRFCYPGPKDQEEMLLVIFDQPAAQAGFVDLLRKMGFTVQNAPLMIS